MKLTYFLLFLILFLNCCSDNNDSNFQADGDSETENSDNEETTKSYSDDPNDYKVDTSVEYEIKISEPRWVVPSNGLPKEAPAAVSNANVDILFHENRLFMAWRAAPYHFASADSVMQIVSSIDEGKNWEFEGKVLLNTDLREPRFLSFNGKLQLIFFEAGTNMLAFEPIRMWRLERISKGKWTDPEIMVDEPEVPWDLKVRNNIAYLTSYKGNHYESGESAVEVYFKQSTDGKNFTKVDDVPFVYKGGVSETAFEFDLDGNMWIVTRNEDGDKTGFGAHVCFAKKESLATWECPEKSDPERYDSPELFRHGKDIFLIGRRDIGGPFDQGLDDLPMSTKKTKYLADYSTRPKRTALYKIDQQNRKVTHIMDLPGCGDTSFPSIKRTGTHSYLMSNYTSPLDDPDISWINAQISERGTQLYFLTITFVPKK